VEGERKMEKAAALLGGSPVGKRKIEGKHTVFGKYKKVVT